jgi:hypothetical protein
LNALCPNALCPNALCPNALCPNPLCSNKPTILAEHFSEIKIRLLWSSYPPEEQKIRVWIPPGCKVF